MGLSVASLNPISSTAVMSTRQAYSIDNQSEISSAYRESIANTATPEGVRGPAPVQYATRRYNVSGVNSLSENQRMTRAYNNIASAFDGINTSYDRNSEASPYQLIGKGFDAFA